MPTATTAVRRLAPPKSPTPDPFWELQWHPSGGGRVRRLIVTRRRVNRWLLVLGLVGSLATACGSWAQLTHTRRLVDRAHEKTRALQAEQARLRETSFELAGRLIQVVEATVPPDSWYRPRLSLPARQADNELVLAWLVAQCAPLERLAEDAGTHHREYHAAVPPADPRLLPALGSFRDDFVVR